MKGRILEIGGSTGHHHPLMYMVVIGQVVTTKLAKPVLRGHQEEATLFHKCNHPAPTPALAKGTMVDHGEALSKINKIQENTRITIIAGPGWTFQTIFTNTVAQVAQVHMHQSKVPRGDSPLKPVQIN